jgi:hypothetical protein
MMFQGLSAYPTDPYYNPGRSDWLPYWLDDTIESRNKIAYLAGKAMPYAPAGTSIIAGALATTGVATEPSQYTNPPAPVPVSPPSDLTGQTADIDQQIADQKAVQLQQQQYWANVQNTVTPVDETSPGALLNRLGDAMSTDPTSIANKYGPYLLIGGVGLFLFALAKR